MTTAYRQPAAKRGNTRTSEDPRQVARRARCDAEIRAGVVTGLRGFTIAVFISATGGARYAIYDVSGALRLLMGRADDAVATARSMAAIEAGRA